MFGHTLTLVTQDSTLSPTKLFLLGGDRVDKKSGTWIFDLQSKKWENKESSNAEPPKRSFHSSVAVGNLIYIFGGKDGNKDAMNDLWIYDTGNMLL
jgi:hypothetical protein